MFANTEADKNSCTRAAHFGQDLLFFVLGGSIGAALALLFAPKSGRELRHDISQAAGRGYDQIIDKAHRVREQAGEAYDAAKEKGFRAFETASNEFADLKHELIDDAARIGGMAGEAARRIAHTGR